MFGVDADFGILRWNPETDTYEPIVPNAISGRDHALLSFATRWHGKSETIIISDARRGPAVFVPLTRNDDFDAALAVFTPHAGNVMGDEKLAELETLRVALSQALANADL